ncbi:hypothetical protein SAMN05192558_105333 [Actinokineospora alba]|uniref:Secreted protein n=1 Tax=Actinokineospora alba TaxID=504798 RepID=A0A1H0NGM2_9PSEU|nr:hypothetical protein [Actinokineospora alba]TDP68703.1 hypothetical protein C8E96_4268 [Actinokineospora alba]SDH84859.1 hypothetical protein SAMN05421871_102383 [Actinokineospora alba]SDO91470.1 hypothetical protein SAMN05192558_105333 [Actinokineospora alba]
MNRRPRAPSKILATCACFALIFVGAGAASADTSTESRQIVFACTTFAADDTVDIAGTLHLVARLTGSDQTGWTLTWRTNVDHTTGTGQSGTHYVVTGADTGTATLPPGPPTRPAPLPATFSLLPPGPPTHPPSPIRLAVHLAYDETGSLVDVQVHIEQTYGTVD